MQATMYGILAISRYIISSSHIPIKTHIIVYKLSEMMQNSYDYPLSLSSYSSRLVYNRIFGTIFKRDLSRLSLPGASSRPLSGPAEAIIIASNTRLHHHLCLPLTRHLLSQQQWDYEWERERELTAWEYRTSALMQWCYSIDFAPSPYYSTYQAQPINDVDDSKYNGN